MDEDALGCIFILIVGALAIGVYLYFAMYLFGITAGIVGVWVFGRVLLAYSAEMWSLALSGTWPTATEEPARVGFFFGPAYSDVARLRKSSLASIAGATSSFDAARASEWDWFTGPAKRAFGYGGYVGWAAGSLIGSVTAVALHMAVLIVSSAVTGVTAGVLGVLQKMWAKIWNISHPCPSCYKKDMPVFVCPHCGAEHSQLRPGKYGVLFHTCQCAINLPTIGILGRRHLPARCRACATMLSETETTDVHLAFAGGPSSGKSSLMYSAVAKLVSSEQGISFADTTQETAIRQELERLKSGSQVTKTVESLPKALHLLFKNRGPVDKSLYVYDVAGESFLSSEDPLRQSYYDHVDGVVFIIDPLSIEDFVEDNRERISDSELTTASKLDPQDAYGRLVQALYQHLGGKTKSIRRTRLAVAVNKIDLPEVGGAINALRTPDGTESEAVRTWLESVGQGNLVHLIERDFGQVRYFSVSALGRSASEAGGGFVGHGVMAPVHWALPVMRFEGAVADA